MFCKNHTDVFDTDFWNVENFEWAILIIDSRISYVDFEGFLVPMLDLANYRESTKNPSKLFKPRFNPDTHIAEIKAIDYSAQDFQVWTNPGLNSDHYLIYHGFVLDPNVHDCYSLTLSFSERNDDDLRFKRKQFFSKYFLFDHNDNDEM
jgi:hypothetical protein